MSIIPTQTRPLSTVSFDSTTDFIDLANHCEHFADTLVETEEPVLKRALYEQLTTCLTLLRPTLNDPIPPHLIESLTVDEYSAVPLGFEFDSESLCEYCLVLVRLLQKKMLPPDMEKTLTGLLTELVWIFSAELKAPRWIRTVDGIKHID